MSYSKLFEQNRVRIHRKAVSTKILDSIHRLMMEVNENSPRRWVWELIQNAGDAAQGEEVEIFIHLKRDGEGWRLEFSHSGRPFNVLTLTSLVNQVSGKERGPREEERESTGRFGTGFMTTHLLSRKVEVRSVIQEEGEGCKRFRILLDRSGTTLREIEEGLDLALGELESLDLVPDCRDLREGELNTVFSYLLDKRGVETALAGIRDLKENVHYMLAFGVGVRGIRLRDEWNGEDVRYRRIGMEEMRREAECQPSEAEFWPGRLSSGMYMAVTECCERVGEGEDRTMWNPGKTAQRRYYLTASGAGVQTAVRVQADRNLRPVRVMGPGSGCARLFCCFPLIGTEAFPFPAVVNSTAFEPTEPRDGIYLTARDIPEVRQNERLLGEAGRQLEQLADCLAGWGTGELFRLLQIPPVPERVWLSGPWIAGKLNGLRFRLCRKPLFTDAEGRRIPVLGPMGEAAVCVPAFGPDYPELTKELWELLRRRNDQKPLPDKEELHYWEELLPECRVNAEQILKQLCSWGKLDILAARLRQEEATAVSSALPVDAAVSSALPAVPAVSSAPPAAAAVSSARPVAAAVSSAPPAAAAVSSTRPANLTASSAHPAGSPTPSPRLAQAKRWLKAFRDLIKQEPALYRGVAAGEYNIFLNREGGLIGAAAARRAGAIPQGLFQAAVKVGVPLEKTVLDPELDDPDLLIRELSVAEVAELVNDRLYYYGMGEQSTYRQAILTVAALRDESAESAGQRRELYQVCQAFFGDSMPEAVDIPVQGVRLWWKSDEFALRMILDTLSGENRVGRELPEIAARLNRTEEETLAWYSRLAELAWRVGGDSLVHYRKRRGGVFPNQKGMLCRPWNLWLDGGVDETVKEVAGDLGLDLKGTLAGFKCRVPVMPVMEKEAASRQLEDRIMEELESPSRKREEGRRQSLHRLFEWMQGNPAEAAAQFKRLYPKRFLLCDQGYLESRDRKAARLDRLLELAGAARLEQLEFLLQAGDGGTDVDPEWEFAGLPDTEARERREAGEWGERFVRDYLVRRFQDKGARLVEQDGQSAMLIPDGPGEERLEVRLMDTAHHKQSGFDIGILKNGELWEYYEVKSTRGGSFSNMNLSRSQAARAFANPGRYHLAAVFYAKTEQAYVKIFCWGEEPQAGMETDFETRDPFMASGS